MVKVIPDAIYLHIGKDCLAVRTKFDEWCEQNRLMIALAQCVRATMGAVEYVPHPLSEAVVRFNARFRREGHL